MLAHARALAAAFELELRTTLDGSRPTVERVGGCGLMVSVRFAPDRCAAFAARRGARRDAPPNLALYSYLLDEHAVRVRPSTTDESAVLVEPPAVASAALFACPLHAQRPLSLLLLLLAFALGRRAPATPGLEWARAVLPVKYIASHPVRAEPYALVEFGKRR